MIQRPPISTRSDTLCPDTTLCRSVPSLWRIRVPASEGEDDETLLSDAKKNRVFAGLLGDDRPITTYHRTLYRVHQRVAHDFRKGRVILAGDAAHLHNPLGGFGMNSGIHDAWNISAKQPETLTEGAETEPLLTRPERHRHN